jgi:sulfite reductase (ferredoxin)
MSYQIPPTLPSELDELAAHVEAFRQGRLDATALKARRVPFGCYEQRQDGTYMVRVRTTGGALSPTQLAALATISTHFHGSALHITTRQEFQIHDVALDDVVAIMRALLAAGLASRGGGGNTVRNIMVSPDAGVGLDEVFDPSPYAFALTTRLIAEPDSWLLPRKFKISFSNSPADTAYAQFNDLGFIARIENGVEGFRVYVAGGMGTKPEVGHLLHDFIPASDTYAVAEALKRLFDKHGNRKNRHAARLRFLWKTLGETRFRQLYDEERQRLQSESPAPLIPTEPASSTPAAPLAVDPGDLGPEFRAWRSRYAEPQKQPGLFSVLVPVFLGNLKNEDALALADLLAPFGSDVVRATLGQNLKLRNIPEAHLPAVWRTLGRVGNLANDSRLIGNAIACPGADTCKLGICRSKGVLSAIARRLGKAGLDLDRIGDFHLNISGCPNTCSQHMLADLGFYGNALRQGQRMYPAYAVVAGARFHDGQARLAQPIERIAARDVPAFVQDVLTVWMANMDRYGSFADYVDAEGADEIRAIAGRYRDIPEFDDDKNYYYDWGADEVFSLVGRGTGECSAGLFDLIDVDLNKAAALRDGLPVEADGATLYQIALLAARALLITRGVEADSDAAVFGSFERHFLLAGLVDQRFAAVVSAGQSADLEALGRQRSEVVELLAEVDKLYRSMDNSLRFLAETAAPSAPPPVAATLERDYRTVACPMNFVKVKLDLEKISKGQTLRVILGDGEPIRNVPRSVEQEGHKILEQVKEGDVWAVLIEKATA